MSKIQTYVTPLSKEKQSKKQAGGVHENFYVLLVCIACGLVLLFSFLKGAETKNGAIVVTQEEHFQIGYEYYATGRLSLNGVPSVFRAPGYPVFVAIGLHVRDAVASLLGMPEVRSMDWVLQDGTWILTINWVFEDGNWILILQLLVLLTGGLFFYKTIRWWLPTIPALIFLSAYLVNPLTHTAVRTLSYSLVDFVMITILIYVCFYLLRASEISLSVLVLSSIFIALAAFVRPIFLTFPILIFGLLFFLKGLDFKEAVKKAGLCLILMATFIAPYVLRNFLVSDSFIPISNQGPWAFWGNSVTYLYSEGLFTETRPRWSEQVWADFGLNEFRKVTGEDYSLEVLYDNSQTLSKYYGRQFIKNLILHPTIYVRNTAGNLVYYIFSPRSFEDFQFRKLFSNYQQDIPNTFIIFNCIATIIVLPILGYFAFRRDLLAKTGLLLIGYFAIIYSIVILLSRYLYTLMPVLWICFAITPAIIKNLYGKNPLRIDYQGIAVVTAGLAFICNALPVLYTLFL